MLLTPLNEIHKNLKAKMVPFAGYEMPVSYTSVKEEYLAVRERCGVFDISHMAPFTLVPGEKDAVIAFLNFVTCREIKEIAIGQVQYNAVMNENGGLVDDITVYNVNNQEYRLIVNASNRSAVFQHFQQIISQQNFAVEVQMPEDYVLLALQGPTAEEILKKYCKHTAIEFKDIYYYEFFELAKGRFPAMISRTGYTGEDGFEILLPKQDGIQLWQWLVGEKVTPCGLAARDLLRLEVFYPLYGNELSMEKTPYQAAIGFIVSHEKPFLGRDRVLAHKLELPGRNRGFIFEEEGVPRSEYPVVTQAGELAGKVTSGSFSFLWNKGFGIAYIDEKIYKNKQPLFVEVRGVKKPIKILNKTPYAGSIKRRRES